MTPQEPPHFNQTPRRKAEFFTPPNVLKSRVGGGGLNDDILNKAQALLEHNSVDFRPLGEMYLDALMRGIEEARKFPKGSEDENIFISMLYPVMQLKANGGMFHYPLVTSIADKLIQFLEVVHRADPEVLEIVVAFHTTIRAILLGQIKGDGGIRGAELMQALVDACYRYFEKTPNNRDARPYDTSEQF